MRFFRVNVSIVVLCGVILAACQTAKTGTPGVDIISETNPAGESLLRNVQQEPAPRQK